MFLVAALTGMHYVFMALLTALSVFMVLVILVQRGRGGGLTGALGGMGGQSAFGTKAGDLFTRITIVVAAIWVLLSMGALKILNNQAATAGYDTRDVGRAASTSKDGGAKMPAEAPATSEATKSGDAPAEKAPPSAAEAPEKTTAAPPAPSGKATEAPAAATPPAKDE